VAFDTSLGISTWPDLPASQPTMIGRIATTLMFACRRSLHTIQPKHERSTGKSPKSAKQTFRRTKPKQPSHNPPVSPVWGTDVDRPARTPIAIFATSASHGSRSIEWLESLNPPLLLSGSCFSLFLKESLTKSVSERVFKTDDGLKM
jgi:hypothetical protein